MTKITSLDSTAFSNFYMENANLLLHSASIYKWQLVNIMKKYVIVFHTHRLLSSSSSYQAHARKERTE